ncbi:phosphoglycerate mutase-like protein, partial [Carica papaya]|uniref:phosphoglycerate mutase-like protein n=1 Tax=Carica papaya TaxID=3649 RepID=UPI000B8CB7E1
MDSTRARYFYPLNHCKIIHLVRHGQAMHNIAAEKDRNLLLSPHLFDAQLSPLGWQQASNLRTQVIASGLLKRVDLVITSPLLRTMQTANAVFGGDDQCCTPSIVALELARDRNGERPSDKRRSVSECRSLFPNIDFSLMESEDDNLWRADARESEEELGARGMEFMQWLWTRPEKEIAIVSHGIMLQYMLFALGSDCDLSIQTELCKRFGNCELRTVVIVDK